MQANGQERKDLDFLKDYIRANIEEPLSLRQLAAFSGYNSAHLSRKFKKIYGINISQYVKETKMTVAANYLKNSTKALCDISEILCFASQSHFQNTFKATYHITPLEYRKHGYHMVMGGSH